MQNATFAGIAPVPRLGVSLGGHTGARTACNRDPLSRPRLPQDLAMTEICMTLLLPDLPRLDPGCPMTVG